MLKIQPRSCYSTMRALQSSLFLCTIVAASGAVASESVHSPSDSDASYWWRYPQSDCGYDDVKGSCAGNTVDECKRVCDATEGCGGFNYPHGILKKTDCLQHKAPQGSVDLYVKQSTPQPPSPTGPWGLLWPIPQQYTMPTGTLMISPTISITTDSKSERLGRAISRYQRYIANTTAVVPDYGTRAPDTSTVSVLHLIVTTPDESLNFETNYSYTLKVDALGAATVTAPTIYGVMYSSVIASLHCHRNSILFRNPNSMQS